MAKIQTNISSASADSEYVWTCRDLEKAYSWIDAAPICCDLQKNHITGIVGKRVDTDRLLGTMLVQLAARDCYTELKIVYLDSGLNMNWAEKLPHTQGLCASTRAEADRTMEEVFALLQKRKAELSNRKSFGNAPAFLPYVLLVVADPALLSKSHGIQEYIVNGAALGTGMVLAVERRKFVTGVFCN